MITIPLEIGDLILAGKFKNKKIIVKEIGYDEYGLPTVNGRGIMKIRIAKLMKDKPMSRSIKENKEYTGVEVPVRIKKIDGTFWIHKVKPSGEEVCVSKTGYETKEQAERAAMLKGYVLLGTGGEIEEYEFLKPPKANDAKSADYKPKGQKFDSIEEVVRRVIIENKAVLDAINNADLYGWDVVFKLAEKYGFDLMSYRPKSIPNAGSPTKDVRYIQFKPTVKVEKAYIDKNGDIIVKTNTHYLRFWADNHGYGGSKLKTEVNRNPKVNKKKLNEADVTDSKIEQALEKLVSLQEKLAEATAQIEALKKQLGVSQMEKEYKTIVDEQLWDFLEQLKKDGDRVARTKNVLLDIQRFQTERPSYEYEKVLDFVMTQVNQDVKYKIINELKAREKISKVKPALSLSRRSESVLKESSIFGKIANWFKSFLSGFNAKMEAKGQVIDKNLDRAEKMLAAIK